MLLCVLVDLNGCRSSLLGACAAVGQRTHGSTHDTGIRLFRPYSNAF